MDPTTLTHGIQLAIAPVSLLTALSALITAVAGRLARIIDRARIVQERLEAHEVRDPPTAMTLFLGETTAIQATRLVSIFFLTGIICFIAALLIFLAETVLATEALKFGRHLPRD